MPHQWIIDVLSDLQSYSGLNGLERLSQELDAVIRVATEEISAAGQEGPAVRIVVPPLPGGFPKV